MEETVEAMLIAPYQDMMNLESVYHQKKIVKEDYFGWLSQQARSVQAVKSCDGVFMYMECYGQLNFYGG